MYTKNEYIWKAIPAVKLIELLQQCPAGALIAVSPMRELLVLTPEEELEGLISLASEEYDASLFTA